MFGIDDAILGTVGAGLVNNMFADSRQDDAQGFSAQQFATRYQTQVKDLQAAGLNPMLAYTQGPGSAPSSSAASASGMGDVGATINQSKMVSAQMANIDADTENKKAQADLIAGQAAQAWASAGQSNANVGLISANVEKVRQEVEKLRGDTNFEQQQQILRNTAWMLYQQGALAQERGISEGQARAQMQATIAKLVSETKLNYLDIKAAEALDNIGRTSKQLQPIVEMLKAFLRK